MSWTKNAIHRRGSNGKPYSFHQPHATKNGWMKKQWAPIRTLLVPTLIGSIWSGYRLHPFGLSRKDTLEFLARGRHLREKVQAGAVLHPTAEVADIDIRVAGFCTVLKWAPVPICCKSVVHLEV